MIGLGTLSAFEDVQALLKSKLGDFLAAEQKLRRLATNPSISIRSEANGLLAVQKSLEAELGTAQAKIAQFQAGAWSFSDAISLGDVGTRLISHIQNVASLEARAGNVVTSGLVSSPMFPMLGIVSAAAVLFLFLRK